MKQMLLPSVKWQKQKKNMKPQKPKKFLRQKATQRLTLRRAMIIGSLALLIGGGVFFVMNFGNNQTGKAAVQEINIVQEDIARTEFSIAEPVISESAIRYSKKEQFINVRKIN
jgi:hypothetical protein